MARSRQQGIILIVTLIALVILMISGIALVRSFNSSLILAGNIAFKRDLVNQGERGVAAAMGSFEGTGALVADSTRQLNSFGNNYSATVLPSDPHGIPLMLLNDTLWTMTGADITDTTSGVTIRYVIDRLCNATGATTTAQCVIGSAKIPPGGTGGLKKPLGNSAPVYRVTVRVTGPRNTQTYMQSTLSF